MPALPLMGSSPSICLSHLHTWFCSKCFSPRRAQGGVLSSVEVCWSVLSPRRPPRWPLCTMASHKLTITCPRRPFFQPFGPLRAMGVAGWHHVPRAFTCVPLVAALSPQRRASLAWRPAVCIRRKGSRDHALPFARRFHAGCVTCPSQWLRDVCGVVRARWR